MEKISRMFMEDLFTVLVGELRKCKGQLFIVSPYITYRAAKVLCATIPSSVKDRTFVTVPPGKDYATGATSPKAINLLYENGFEIRTVERLHAKLYLFDQNVLVMGSANFTDSGLTLSKHPNEELLLKVELDKDLEEYDALAEEYWNHADRLIADKKWLIKIEEEYKSLAQLYDNFERELERKHPTPGSRYIDFLDSLCNDSVIDSYNHIPAGMGKNAYTLHKDGKRIKVKICVSDNRITPPNDSDDYYSFTIAQYSRKVIRDKGIGALLLVLRGSINYLLIPKNITMSEILDRGFKKKGWVWQFQVKDIEGRMTLQVSSNSHRESIDVSQYLNLKL